MDLEKELQNLPICRNEKRPDGGERTPGDWDRVTTFNGLSDTLSAIGHFAKNSNFAISLGGARIEVRKITGSGDVIIYYYRVDELIWQEHYYCYSD
jgi:hypothetical protein